MTTNNTSIRIWPGIVLFFASVVVGLSLYQDYGISWDEPIQREIGTLTYNYVSKGDQAFKSSEFRDLGTGFELVLVFIEKKLHIEDSRDIYLARHLATHLLFLLSVFCGYILCLRLFKDQFIACLGFVLLAFMPRIYAHSYFNSKDIPFLCSFIITFMVGQMAFEKNRSGWYLLLGLAAGYATSIRAMGILLVPCFLPGRCYGTGLFIISRRSSGECRT